MSVLVGKEKGRVRDGSRKTLVDSISALAQEAGRDETEADEGESGLLADEVNEELDAVGGKGEEMGRFFGGGGGGCCCCCGKSADDRVPVRFDASETPFFFNSSISNFHCSRYSESGSFWRSTRNFVAAFVRLFSPTSGRYDLTAWRSWAGVNCCNWSSVVTRDPKSSPRDEKHCNH